MDGLDDDSVQEGEALGGKRLGQGAAWGEGGERLGRGCQRSAEPSSTRWPPLFPTHQDRHGRLDSAFPPLGDPTSRALLEVGRSPFPN